MKLIQLNAWGGRLEYRFLDFLKEQQPDILCLQEIIDIQGARGSLFASVEDILETLRAEYYYMSPVFSFNYMHRKANFGNCIISKYPIKSKQTIFTGREYVDNFDWTKHTQNIRNLQYAEIFIDNEPVHIFNHHGHHVHEHKNGDDESMRQCEVIADEVSKKPGKVILTGDFNLSPHAKSLSQINKVLINQSIKAKLKTTRNQMTYKSEVCDYIFTSKEVKVKDFFASKQIISDHQALILEFS